MPWSLENKARIKLHVIVTASLLLYTQGVIVNHLALVTVPAGECLAGRAHSFGVVFSARVDDHIKIIGFISYQSVLQQKFEIDIRAQKVAPYL